MIVNMNTYVDRAAGFGRGVFAKEFFRKGQLVEVSPVILLKEDDVTHGDAVLDHYVYEWEEGVNALALGNGSLFNHGLPANVDWEANKNEQSIEYRATRDIPVGEQLFIDYGPEAPWW